MGFIAIVGISTFISVAAYMIQHGDLYTPKTFSELAERTHLKAEIRPIDLSIC